MRISSSPLVCAVVLLTLTGCACPEPPPAAPSAPAGSAGAGPAPAAEPAPGPAPVTGARTLAVPASHPHHARVEGVDFQNACQDDSGCFVGGCSSEVCSAEEGVSSTCEMPADGWPSAGASCGCVQGECVWYREADATAPAAAEEASGAELPGQGAACTEEGRCGPGLTCVRYRGVAGAAGPEFKTCEVRCGEGGSCPPGQRCVTIADGPGQVCRR
jgi:eight-cysteine-cluster-containing protein